MLKAQLVESKGFQFREQTFKTEIHLRTIHRDLQGGASFGPGTSVMLRPLWPAGETQGRRTSR
jgi:hypothetical protein